MDKFAKLVFGLYPVRVVDRLHAWIWQRADPGALERQPTVIQTQSREERIGVAVRLMSTLSLVVCLLAVAAFVTFECIDAVRGSLEWAVHSSVPLSMASCIDFSRRELDDGYAASVGTQLTARLKSDPSLCGLSALHAGVARRLIVLSYPEITLVNPYHTIPASASVTKERVQSTYCEVPSDPREISISSSIAVRYHDPDKRDARVVVLEGVAAVCYQALEADFRTGYSCPPMRGSTL